MSATSTAKDSPAAPSPVHPATPHRKSKKSSRLFIFSLLAALIIAGGWYFGTYLPGHKHIELSGLVQAKEVKNASRFGGRVTKVLVNEGDTVKAGQPLIYFDDIDLKAKIADARASLTEAKARRSLLLAGAGSGDLKKASAQVEQASQQLKILTQGATAEQVEQAKSSVAQAKIRLDSAQAAYKGADRMLDEGIISQQKYQEIINAYDAAKSQQAAADAVLKSTTRGARPEDVRIARAQQSAARAQYQQLAQGAKRQDLEIADAAVSQAESNLDALQSQLSETALKAPIDGVVSLLTVTQGELVQPGRPVITILDSKDLWADVFVPESELGQVQVGQKVRVIPTALKDVWYDGKVSSISMKSEFVPEGGQSTNNASKDDEAAFKMKVLVPGNSKPQGKGTKPNLYLRAGMSVHVEL